MRFEQFFAKFWIPGFLGASSGLFPGLFRASSWPLPGLFRASSWPLFGLFLASSGQNPGQNSVCHQRRHFLFIKYCDFEQFFAKFWIPGVLVSFFEYFLASSWPHSGPASSWPVPSLFLASSGPLPGLFWPLPGLFWPLLGLFLDSSKSPKFSGPPRDVIFCS